MVELWFVCFEYYPYIQMWQYMLVCGVRAKPVTHLMQYHLLQWEVAKVKPLMNSNMTLTVLNLIQSRSLWQGQRSNQDHAMMMHTYAP